MVDFLDKMGTFAALLQGGLLFRIFNFGVVTDPAAE